MSSRYKILKDLGKGAMGEVVLANDTNLDRKVALKFLSVHVESDREYVDRIMREARIAADLNHPNIVHVYDFGEFADSDESGDYDGRIYISMEFVEGQTLKAFLKESRKLSNKKILHISRQIAEALAYAHKRDIFHRDIKPENILLTAEDQVKLLDFGLAKSANVSTLTNDQILGTPYYMSPEQAEGEQDIDYRTDIFSFGIVLYELITLERPFQGDTFEVVKHAIQHKQPTPLSQFNKDAPNGLQRIVDKCLAKRRADRYQSTTEIIKALQREERIIQPYGGIAAAADDASPREWKESLIHEAKTRRKQKEAEEVNRLLTTAHRQYAKGRFDAAVDSFKGVIAIEPEHPEANEYLVRIRKSLEQRELLEKLIVDAQFYWTKKKYEEATELYERILKIDPQNKIARRRLARGERRLHGGSMSLPWLAPRLLMVLAGIAITWFVANQFTAQESATSVTDGEEMSFVDKDAEITTPAPADEDPVKMDVYRQTAIEAKERMLEQKNAAVNAGAANLAQSLFASARLKEEDGNLKLASTETEQLMAAEQDFLDAEDMYLAALSEVGRQQKSQYDAAAARKSAQAEKAKMLHQKARIPESGRSSNSAFATAESYELDGDAQFERRDFMAASRSYRQASSRYKTAGEQIETARRAAETRQARQLEKELRESADSAREAFEAKVGGLGESDWQAKAEFTLVQGLIAEAIAAYEERNFQRAIRQYNDASEALNDVMAARESVRRASSQTREQDEKAIKSLIDDFKLSIEQGNYRAFESILPLSKEEGEKWSIFFSVARNAKVVLENPLIRIERNTGFVDLQGVVYFHNSSNNSKGETRLSQRWELQKNGDGWRVISK
jgi:serine/threonine-protein kinase